MRFSPFRESLFGINFSVGAVVLQFGLRAKPIFLISTIWPAVILPQLVRPLKWLAFCHRRSRQNLHSASPLAALDCSRSRLDEDCLLRQLAVSRLSSQHASTRSAGAVFVLLIPYILCFSAEPLVSEPSTMQSSGTPLSKPSIWRQICPLVHPYTSESFDPRKRKRRVAFSVAALFTIVRISARSNLGAPEFPLRLPTLSPVSRF
jgi:hypothetical protein